VFFLFVFVGGWGGGAMGGGGGVGTNQATRGSDHGWTHPRTHDHKRPPAPTRYALGERWRGGPRAGGLPSEGDILYRTQPTLGPTRPPIQGARAAQPVLLWANSPCGCRAAHARLHTYRLHALLMCLVRLPVSKGSGGYQNCSAGRAPATPRTSTKHSRSARLPQATLSLTHTQPPSQWRLPNP